MLVSDDDEAVSISAREALESLFVLDEEFVTKFEVSEMLSRFFLILIYNFIKWTVLLLLQNLFVF